MHTRVSYFFREDFHLKMKFGFIKRENKIDNLRTGFHLNYEKVYFLKPMNKYKFN